MLEWRDRFFLFIRLSFRFLVNRESHVSFKHLFIVSQILYNHWKPFDPVLWGTRVSFALVKKFFTIGVQ